MEIKQHISLKKLNTFGVNVRAAFGANPRNEEQLRNLIDSSRFRDNHFIILGEGSNVLFTDDFPGLIINLDIRGINIIDSADDIIEIEAGAGENWHRFVETCLRNKWYGLENLALIPGTVGAAPIQNIGAYGVEQSDSFLSLRGFNLEKQKYITMKKEECGFSYRSSIFKNELKDKFIITSVRYKLKKYHDINISYSDIQNEINKFAVEHPDPQYVFDAVVRLRKRKLPKPEELGNAGSFFKNPVLDKKKFNDLKPLLNGAPVYPYGENKVKLSAGWLIESLGWKGKRRGDAGVYEKHALILVNYGNAAGEQILNLAREIESSVFEKYGVKLEREVRVV